MAENVRLPPELIRELKLFAVERDTNMGALLCEWIPHCMAEVRRLEREGKPRVRMPARTRRRRAA
jgi:hypothetical protein